MLQTLLLVSLVSLSDTLRDQSVAEDRKTDVVSAYCS